MFPILLNPDRLFDKALRLINCCLDEISLEKYGIQDVPGQFLVSIEVVLEAPSDSELSLDVLGEARVEGLAILPSEPCAEGNSNTNADEQFHDVVVVVLLPDEVVLFEAADELAKYDE